MSNIRELSLKIQYLPKTALNKTERTRTGDGKSDTAFLRLITCIRLIKHKELKILNTLSRFLPNKILPRHEKHGGLATNSTLYPPTQNTQLPHPQSV